MTCGWWTPSNRPPAPSWKVPAGRYLPGQKVTFSIIDKTPFASALSVGTRWDSPRIGAQATVRLTPGATAAPDPFAVSLGAPIGAAA